jgi:phage terminase large subunit-like protein
MGKALRSQAHVEGVGSDIDALDQQLDDAGLLGGKQFVPQGIQLLQSIAHRVFRQALDLRPRGAPCRHYDFGRPQHAAQLVDDGGLDLSRRHATHGAGLRALLQDGLADVVAIQPIATASMGRARAEFLLIAPTVSLAHIAFSQALGMVDKDPDGFLPKRMHVQEHLRKITDRRTKATLEIKAFDTSVLTGVKPAGVLIDELHEIARNPAAERLIGQLRGGLLPNPEGFLMFITTQSDEPPRGAFRSELMVARAVRDGRAQGAMLPVLYEFPEDIANDRSSPPAWQDPKNWWMVTPNRDRSVFIARLQEDWEKAKLKGQGEIVRWASQHLNIEIGLSLRSDRWVGAVYWEQATDSSLTLEKLLSRSEVVVIGIDGGGLDDLLGLAVLGREKETRRWLLWSRGWAHKSVLDRRKGEASNLRDFQDAGELTVYEEFGQDIAKISQLAKRIDEKGLLHAVALDPYGVGAIVDALDEVGISGQDRIVGITQGWKLTGAIKTAERKLADGTLRHGGQRLMSWCVSNARVEPKGNAIAITKQASGSAKIDPLMAMFNALALMATNPQPAPSYQMIIL